MAINSIVVDPNNGSANKPNLTLILATGLIAAVYELRDDLIPGYDFGSPDVGVVETPEEISWSNESGYNTNNGGELYTFNAISLRLILKRYAAGGISYGDNVVNVTVTSLDATTGSPNNTLTTEESPAKMYNIPVGDIVSEKVRVKVSGKNAVFLNKLVLWVSEKVKLRPRP